MPTTCLTDLIFVPDGCTALPSGKTSLSQLPGFDINHADYLNDSQQLSGFEVMQDAVNRASDKIVSDFRSHMDIKGRFASVVDKGTIGFYDENKVTDAVKAGQYAGLEILVSDYPYLKFNLNSVSVFFASGITDNLYIIDVIQGRIIDTIPFTSVAGQITNVLINKTYPTNGQDLHLMVAVDAGLSVAFDTWINPTNCASCSKGRRSRFSDLLFTRAVKTSKTGSLTDTALVGIGYTHGVSLNYSIECDDNTWLCQFSNRLRRAMLYASGVELMDEVLFSDRLNNVTTINKEDANEKRSLYVQYYNIELQQLLANLRLPNDRCYSCTPMVVNRVNIP
jgi:hypothetical protein